MQSQDSWALLEGLLLYSSVSCKSLFRLCIAFLHFYFCKKGNIFMKNKGKRQNRSQTMIYLFVDIDCIIDASVQVVVLQFQTTSSNVSFYTAKMFHFFLIKSTNPKHSKYVPVCIILNTSWHACQEYNRSLNNINILN